VQRSGKNTC